MQQDNTRKDFSGAEGNAPIEQLMSAYKAGEDAVFDCVFISENGNEILHSQTELDKASRKPVTQC